MIKVKRHLRKGRIVRSHARYNKRKFNVDNTDTHAHPGSRRKYLKGGLHQEELPMGGGQTYGRVFKERSNTNIRARDAFRGGKKTLSGKSKIDALKNLLKANTR